MTAFGAAPRILRCAQDDNSVGKHQPPKQLLFTPYRSNFARQYQPKNGSTRYSLTATTFYGNMISSLLKQLLILPIRAYQLLLSPLLGANKCRYQPTCSHYAIEAIQEWGIFKGTYLAVKRILRCHPWSSHPMHDPIPKKEEK